MGSDRRPRWSSRFEPIEDVIAQAEAWARAEKREKAKMAEVRTKRRRFDRRMMFDRRVGLIDVESTGLDPLADRVIEVALAVAEPDGRISASRSWFVNPGREITAEITEITGITNEDVMGAPTFGAIAHELAALMPGDAIPAAYNAPFDRRFISAEWSRLGREIPPFLRHNVEWLDPLVWVKFLDKYAKGKGRFKLAISAERMGISVETAHRALADVETALSLYQKQKALLVVKFQGPPTVDRFMMYQKILAAKQEEDFLTFIAGLPEMELIDGDEVLRD